MKEKPLIILYALIAITAIFAGLKLFDVFPYSWVAVFAPIWIPVVALLAFVCFGMIAILIFSDRGRDE